MCLEKLFVVKCSSSTQEQKSKFIIHFTPFKRDVKKVPVNDFIAKRNSCTILLSVFFN